MDNNKDDDLSDDGKRFEKVVVNVAESNKKRKHSGKPTKVGDNVAKSSKRRKDVGIPDTVWLHVAGPSKRKVKQSGELHEPISLDQSHQPIDPKLLHWDDSTSIDELANEILEMIGAYFAIDGLMNSVPMLNSKWTALQERIAIKKEHLIVFNPNDQTLHQQFLKVFAKYSGLKLLKPVYSSVLSYNVGLLPKDDNDMTVLQLAQRKFPNIKSVSVLTFTLHDTWDKFAKLIDCWPNLVELNLIGFRLNNTNGIAERRWIELSDKINNTLVGMKHLTLFGRVVDDVEIDLNRLVALGQLESLYVGSFDVNLARLESIRRLGLWHMRNKEWFGQLAHTKKVVAGRITELTIFPGIDQLGLHYVDMIGEKFPALEYLYIRTRLPLNEALAPLAQLTKLKHLRIWNRQLAPLSYIDSTELESLQPLENVELLHLNIRLVTHSQLDWVPRLFPNLKWIKLDWFISNCEECADKDKCGRIILQPLAQCGQLRRVYLDISRLEVEDCPPEHLTNSWQKLALNALVVDSE